MKILKDFSGFWNSTPFLCAFGNFGVKWGGNFFVICLVIFIFKRIRYSCLFKLRVVFAKYVSCLYVTYNDHVYNESIFVGFFSNTTKRYILKSWSLNTPFISKKLDHFGPFSLNFESLRVLGIPFAQYFNNSLLLYFARGVFHLMYLLGLFC